MILLINERDSDASVTMPGRVWNEAHPPRRYQAIGHYLELNGPGHIISYDAEELCKNPCWRLATAQEQQTYAKMQRKARQVEEAAPPPPAAPDMPAAPEAAPPVVEAAAPLPTAPVSQVLTTATAPKSA